MEEIYTNIYRESRKKAGLEQSEAADMIGVSYHSLAKYEKKINPLIPPDDVVRNMVIAYNDRSLAYKHIKASPLGEFLPNFECSKDLSIATLTFLSDFNTIEGMISQVIEVTKDGKIDETELEEWEQFKKKGLELFYLRSLPRWLRYFCYAGDHQDSQGTRQQRADPNKRIRRKRF